MFNGKIHYFYGKITIFTGKITIFHSFLLVYQRVLISRELFFASQDEDHPGSAGRRLGEDAPGRREKWTWSQGQGGSLHR